MNNLTIYLAIEDDEGRFKFSANWDEKKKQYYVPSLTVPIELGGSETFWDNNIYLYDTLLPYLKRYASRELTRLDKVDDVHYYFSTHEDEVPVLIDILEKGKTMGWANLK